MARKHHVKKERTTGGYQRRLAKRGLGASPTMPDLATLRRKQTGSSAEPDLATYRPERRR